MGVLTVCIFKKGDSLRLSNPHFSQELQDNLMASEMEQDNLLLEMATDQGKEANVNDNNNDLPNNVQNNMLDALNEWETLQIYTDHKFIVTKNSKQ